ncbi:MAG: asparagine synthase-related protein [Thermoplasmatota archaeon]
MASHIGSFLLFGYFLDYRDSNVQFDFSNVDPKKYIDTPESELIDLGIGKLKNSVRKLMDDRKEIVVPLSGGMDSRAVAACLHEFRGGEDIICYTYGLPGSYDYEIAREISKKLKIRLELFSLKDYGFSIEEEGRTAERFRYQTLLFFHPPMKQLEDLVGDRVIWSGFLGGEIGGSHVLANPSGDVRSAKENFVKKNTYLNADSYLDIDKSDLHDLLDLRWENNERLHMNDQLDFLNRQMKYIAPHVLMKGFEYRTPFFNTEFYDFMISLPIRYRLRKYLYKKILVKAYPDLFSFGVKENVGLKPDASMVSILGMGLKERLLKKVQGPARRDRRLNYYDVDEEIRNNESLRRIVRKTIVGMDRRKLGLKHDPEILLKDHLARRRNAGGFLVTLSSLRIIEESGNLE